MRPGLYIVSTPIGNLADITFRAVETLKNSSLILCEDTRITSKLLKHYEINNKMLRYDDHSNEKQRQKIIHFLKNKEIISLVSDAGTPLISDPGYKLIKDAQAENIYITSVPGASSVISALSISGLPTDDFRFIGFLPKKQSSKDKIFEEIKYSKSTIIFFDRASRIFENMQNIASILENQNRAIRIIRELTKKFEEVIAFHLNDLSEMQDKLENLKGELVILVSPFNIEKAENIDEEMISSMLRRLIIEKNFSVKDASKEVSDILGLPRKEIYKKALKII